MSQLLYNYESKIDLCGSLKSAQVRRVNNIIVRTNNQRCVVIGNLIQLAIRHNFKGCASFVEDLLIRLGIELIMYAYRISKIGYLSLISN